MHDDRRDTKATEQGPPVVPVTAKPGGDCSAGHTRAAWRREEGGEVAVGEPRGIERPRVRAVDVWVGLMKGREVEPLERRALRGTESGQRRRNEIGEPVTGYSYCIHEHQVPDAVLILLGGEHRDASAPRVSKHIPAREPECVAKRGNVAGVMLDAC